jgi:Holliday junction resolvase RusA-like endonuclease
MLVFKEGTATEPIIVTIPGMIRSKKNTYMGNSHMFKDVKVDLYESHVKLHYLDQTEGFQRMLTGPLMLIIDVFYPISKSKSEKAKERMRSGEERPIRTPDVDNIHKIIADGIEKSAFLNDKQIVESLVRKYYSEDPFVVLTLDKITKDYTIFELLQDLRS